MQPIQLYSRDVDPGVLTSTIRYDPSRNIEAFLTDEDRRLVDAHWPTRVARGFRDNLMGSLWDTQNGLTFIGTKFSFYDAIATYLERGEKPFSEQMYELTRTSNVGIALITADDKVLVQRRAAGLLAGGKLDSSASGGCIVRDGGLNFQRTLLEKVARELNLAEEDLSELAPTGVHRSLDYTTIQVTYRGRTRKSFEEVQAQAAPKYVAGVIPVPQAELLGFVIDHYAQKQDLIGDACAVLLSSLEREAFREGVREINQRGGKIQFGCLQDGAFIETAEPQ